MNSKVAKGDLEWLMFENIQAPHKGNTWWWTTDKPSVNIESTFGGLCGRVISTAETYEINENGIVTPVSDFCSVPVCYPRKDLSGSIRPYSGERGVKPEDENPCWQCLRMYAEVMRTFAEKKHKSIKALRKQLKKYMKPKVPFRHIKKSKRKEIDSFEKMQLRQFKRLATTERPAILPWEI